MESDYPADIQSVAVYEHLGNERIEPAKVDADSPSKPTLGINHSANTLLSRPAIPGTWVRAAFVFAVVGLCYTAGAELAWGIFGAGSGLAFFPPAGVTLAAMVLLPRRSWPVVVAAVVAAEITVDLRHSLSLATAMGWALANSVEPIVGASLLRRLQRSPQSMSHRLGLLRFLLAGVIGGPLVASVIGGIVRAATSNTSLVSAALHFWVGDGLGVLAIAAPILACSETRPWTFNRDLFEAVGFQLLVLTVSVLAFWVWTVPPTFLVLPVLVVGAIRYATPGITVASAVMAVVANTATAAGNGPFVQIETSPQNQLAFVQLFLASVMVTVWYLAIETADRATSSAAQTYERAARERAEATRAIGDLSENLLSTIGVRDIASVVGSSISSRFDLSLCGITLLNRETGRFDPQNTGLSFEVVDAITQWTLHTESPGPMAVATGHAVWVDSQADLLNRFPDLCDLAAIENLHAMGALPLRGADLLGYLGLARSEDRPFSSAERDDLGAIALVVSQAVQRAEIYEAERQTRLALEVAKHSVDSLLVQSGIEATRLRESENRFRQMADGSPMLIWIVDHVGRFEWANASVYEYFGLSIEQFVRKGFEHVFHADDVEDFGEVFRAALAAGEPFKGEWKVQAGGQWRWVEMWGRPRLDPAGVFCGYVGNSVDMTDRHDGEELLRSIAALQQMRLRLVEVFAGIGADSNIHAVAAVELGTHLRALHVQWFELDSNENFALVVQENRGHGHATTHSARPVLVDEHDTIVVEALRSGRAFSVTNVLSDDRLTERSKAIAVEFGISAFVIEPVLDNGHISEVLIVEHDHPHEWTEIEMLAIEETAKRTQVALDAQRHAHTAARLRQVEHEAVLTLQHALLPDTIRWHPSVIVQARYRAASNVLEVGGDWYDTFAWPTGHLGLMVGDVVGHNIASAAAMGRMRAAALALAGALAPSPAVILDALDLFALGPDGTDYATAVCVIVDPGNGRLTYSSAGHPPVIVVNPDGTTNGLFQAQSGPLGVAVNGSRSEASIDLEPGALVVLYSDGLIERRGESLDVGIARLEHLLALNRDVPASELADLIVTNLTAESPPTDDIVIACFRYTPAVAQLHLHVEAKSDQLAGMRDAIRIWLDTREVGPEDMDDVLLVVGEACANTIDHAYRHQSVGAIAIELTDHTHHIGVRIIDQGSWRPAGKHSANRGRGITIMQALTDCFDIQRGVHGTAINCTIKLSASRAAQLVLQP